MIYDTIVFIICLFIILSGLIYISNHYYRWVWLNMTRIKLDDPPRKIWNLNQLHINDCFVGIPRAEYHKNKKGNQFIRLMLDAGYSTLHIYFLVFDFPEQKILNSKYNNSFQLVKFYREANGIPVDDDITQLHDISWSDIIDWLNSLLILKICVTSKDMAGYRNIRFVDMTDNNLANFVGFDKYVL